MIVDDSRPITWGTFVAVQRGLARISYEQFKTIIAATISCGDDYAAAAWSEFHGDRINYCMSRHPEEQGYALVNLAYQLNNKENDNGDESKEDERTG